MNLQEKRDKISEISKNYHIEMYRESANDMVNDSNVIMETLGSDNSAYLKFKQISDIMNSMTDDEIIDLAIGIEALEA